MRSGFKDFICPFICGVVEGRHLYLGGKHIIYTLISRRDKSRAGMRFMSRGADIDGNVSNFAETEQILAIRIDGGYRVYSYLQTRGSIPVIWEQTPNLKWEPSILIEANKEKNRRAFCNHMEAIKSQYGENLIVNLIDKKNNQLLIGDYLTNMYNSIGLPKTNYIWFDFHHECRNMKWNNLSKLIDQISIILSRFSHTQCNVWVREGDQREVSIFKKQKGVVRTNCMDCLDRTNVVQSVIARIFILSHFYDVSEYLI